MFHFFQGNRLGWSGEHSLELTDLDLFGYQPNALITFKNELNPVSSTEAEFFP